MSVWENCRELLRYRDEDRANGHLNPDGYLPSFDRLLDQALAEHPELVHPETP